jgi:hypothetical protein
MQFATGWMDGCHTDVVRLRKSVRHACGKPPERQSRAHTPQTPHAHTTQPPPPPPPRRNEAVAHPSITTQTGRLGSWKGRIGVEAVFVIHDLNASPAPSRGREPKSQPTYATASPQSPQSRHLLQSATTNP